LCSAPPAGGGATGGLRRRIHRKLTGAVQTYTLARFRADDAQHGGIDLSKLRADMEARADEVLIAKLRSGLTMWTALVLIVLPTAAYGQAYVAILLLHAK
jgi:hypothetical protein